MKNFTTNRLMLAPLALQDAGFILELLNTPGWIKFIGDRNIKNEEDALAYIHKLTDEPAPGAAVLVVRTKEDETATGVITFLKRDYLDHHDIGFAFLPQHAGKGYAYEAARAVLDDMLAGDHKIVLAMTLPENTSSIRLLEKLGLRFEHEITRDNETLRKYAIHRQA